MILTMRGHAFRFELENVCRLFLPHEKVLVPKEGECLSAQGVIADTALEKGAGETVLTVRLRLDDFDETRQTTVGNDRADYRDECELQLATLLYHLLVKLFGFTQEWGIVTGVRPVKLMRYLTRESGPQEACRYFRERLLVSEQKIELCRRTLAIEDEILALSRPDSFSLYVSIPFCPTRCDYCSFVSHTVERAARLIPVYVDRLVEEITATGAIARRLGLRLETVYFGGGTPTTLSAEQLTRLFQAVEGAFDLSRLREYTVEAGRPDTVTVDKLRAIRAAGVGRISINPQTLRDDVLQKIGRRHSVAQFYDAYDLAVKTGFDHINTDLIAGLPGDDAKGFETTLAGILALDPASVTVHTLSMKRAANLTVQHRADVAPPAQTVQMVAHSATALPRAGYRPYYLYRQSRMVGNQENVGWAKPGYEGLYNVFIMDETHTILGCGAGAVTKLKQPGTDRLERVFNYKFPYEYNTGLDELLRRKDRVISFYEESQSNR
ncbi:MAG: coproporphyrinogen dehydrogenase HemZ [Acutalibacteraceae bacterium]|jgi:oxygen-independent coproporphyrinogen-3 oxidase